MLRHDSTRNLASDGSARNSTSPTSVTADVRVIIEPGPDTAPFSSLTSPRDSPDRAAQAAAAGVTGACGVRRDDAIWVTECAWCKRLRRLDGNWEMVASSVRAAMGTERTHGVCPTCAQGLMARAESEDRLAG